MPSKAAADGDTSEAIAEKPQATFRLRLLIPGVYAEKGKRGTLLLPGDGIRVQFRRRRRGDHKIWSRTAGSACVGVAWITCGVPEKAHDALMVGHVMLAWAGPDAEYWDWDGVPDALRESLKSTLESVETKLRGAIQTTYGLLRWRQGLPGEAHLGLGVLECSLDGQAWREVPSPDRPFSFDWNMHGLRFTGSVAKEVAGSLKAGVLEPTAHELFREAWNQRAENTRSALVVGMAAAEIGVKEFLVKRIPEAAWFVTETPSPDLLKILTQLICPMLSGTALRFDAGRGKDGFADPVLRDLQKGVTLRNETVHKPRMAPDADAVGRVLRSVRDLLYLLDYHAGHAWAAKRIRHDNRERWARADAG